MGYSTLQVQDCILTWKKANEVSCWVRGLNCENVLLRSRFENQIKNMEQATIINAKNVAMEFKIRFPTNGSMGITPSVKFIVNLLSLLVSLKNWKFLFSNFLLHHSLSILWEYYYYLMVWWTTHVCDFFECKRATYKFSPWIKPNWSWTKSQTSKAFLSGIMIWYIISPTI